MIPAFPMYRFSVIEVQDDWACEIHANPGPRHRVGVAATMLSWGFQIAGLDLYKLGSLGTFPALAHLQAILMAFLCTGLRRASMETQRMACWECGGNVPSVVTSDLSPKLGF